MLEVDTQCSLLHAEKPSFKHTEQQTRRNQLKLSDQILLLPSVFEQSEVEPPSLFIVAAARSWTPSVPEGNVTHYAPCY